MYRQLLSIIILVVVAMNFTSGLPWQLAQINTNSDLTFAPEDNQDISKRDIDPKDDSKDDILPITAKNPSSSTDDKDLKPDAWKDQAADLDLGLLNSNMEGSGYAADAPSDDSDIEGSGAPKIFLKSDAQLAQADQPTQADQVNGSSSSSSGGSSGYPANFASTLQQDGAELTFSIVDNSSVKVDGQVDIGAVLGYVDRASAGYKSQSPADDVVAIYISLKNGKTASGMLASLSSLDDVLKALYGTDSVELKDSTTAVDQVQGNSTQQDGAE